MTCESCVAPPALEGSGHQSQSQSQSQKSQSPPGGCSFTYLLQYSAHAVDTLHALTSRAASRELVPARSKVTTLPSPRCQPAGSTRRVASPSVFTRPLYARRPQFSSHLDPRLSWPPLQSTRHTAVAPKCPRREGASSSSAGSQPRLLPRHRLQSATFFQAAHDRLRINDDTRTRQMQHVLSLPHVYATSSLSPAPLASFDCHHANCCAAEIKS